VKTLKNLNVKNNPNKGINITKIYKKIFTNFLLIFKYFRQTISKDATGDLLINYQEYGVNLSL